jgi:hypothetical protein
MTDTSITDAGNVTPLPVKTKRTDSTAALRQRRSREKQSGQSAPPWRKPCNWKGQAESKPMSRRACQIHVTPTGMIAASYAAAFALAGVSAFFSITGMTSIFIGRRCRS